MGFKGTKLEGQVDSKFNKIFLTYVTLLDMSMKLFEPVVLKLSWKNVFWGAKSAVAPQIEGQVGPDFKYFDFVY